MISIHLFLHMQSQQNLTKIFQIKTEPTKEKEKPERSNNDQKGKRKIVTALAWKKKNICLICDENIPLI